MGLGIVGLVVRWSRGLALVGVCGRVQVGRRGYVVVGLGRWAVGSWGWRRRGCGSCVGREDEIGRVECVWRE